MKPTKGKVKVKGVISPMIELGAGFDGNLTAREKYISKWRNTWIFKRVFG